jgi:hypothetical protein
MVEMLKKYAIYFVSLRNLATGFSWFPNIDFACPSIQGPLAQKLDEPSLLLPIS